ncbi:hypothetical protein AB0L70_41045 [Kribbella sp. NPDC051952]|uniref:hypothetical protein n=1 Tax=Kribbella sp. NPDC051952 TaxID=3154851 RepID=UPI00342D0BE9
MQLTVREPVTPSLRLELASGRRLLLRQDGQVVLLVRADTDNYGLRVFRTGRYESVLPPLRRTSRSPDGWVHQFANHLRNGPLHVGTWELEARPLPAYSLAGDLVREYPATYLDWFGDGWNGVLPLSELPDENTSRVKACRKQAAEGILPPILLWWVSALDGWLLLDGHSRLVAARAEGIEPPVIQLSLAMDPDDHADVIRRATDRHQQAMEQVARQVEAGVPGADRAAERLQRAFGDLCSSGFAVRTRGWPLRGGAAEWDRIAAAEAPGWVTD